MGMDVVGRKNPDAYFRNSVWNWRPLAAYACDIAPEITQHCRHWQSNDGDGLSEKNSKALADVLEQEIKSGRCETYAKIRQAEIDALPSEVCFLCEGTGRRKEPPLSGAGNVPCNGCNSTGSRRPNDVNYPFSVENVERFVKFLRKCGGFKIF